MSNTTQEQEAPTTGSEMPPGIIEDLHSAFTAGGYV